MDKEGKEIAMTVHPKEAALLNAIRKNYRYGVIELYTRDGLPFRIRRVQEFDDLTPLSEEQIQTL